MSKYSNFSENQKQLLADSRYGYWLTYFQWKFYSRAGSLCNFLQIMLGSSVVALLNQHGTFAAVVGGVVAFIGAIQLVVPFGQYAERADKACARFQEFQTQIPKIPEVDAEEKLSRLQITGIPSWKGMEVLAVNRVCDIHEEPNGKMRVTWSARFFDLFV